MKGSFTIKYPSGNAMLVCIDGNICNIKFTLYLN